jgi:peptidyl-prolyl cis-trans isomerase A (cyclophilin A)
VKVRSLTWLALAALIAASCNKQKQKSAEEQDWDSESEPTSAAEPKKPAQEPGPKAPPSTASRPDANKSDSVEGYQVIRARTKNGDTTSIHVQPPKGWQIMAAPTEPDPHNGQFTLAEAVKGLPKQGMLAAQIKTNMGSFYCDLFDDKAPVTVANFVGLARGLRKYWDADKVAWTARPYYDGTTFHRVIPGFMIQGGDHTGTGKGGIGYLLKDEPHPSLRHDKAGQLCMANRGRDTNEAQFFVTEAAAPHLDGSYTIFGQCEPAALAARIARVPQSGAPQNTPLTPVTIEKVEVRRLAGGAAKWMPASAKLPAMPSSIPQGRAVEVPRSPKGATESKAP